MPPGVYTSIAALKRSTVLCRLTIVCFRSSPISFTVLSAKAILFNLILKTFLSPSTTLMRPLISDSDLSIISLWMRSSSCRS